LSNVCLQDAKGLGYLQLGDAGRFPSLVFLHGIMGNKKNLRTLAGSVLQRLPQSSAVIFDLRNHGDSTKHWAPFTVNACALDVAQACQKLELAPTVIIGHSFGGKVALLAAKHLETVEQVWLLDCPPGPVKKKHPLKDSSSPTALDIIDILSRIEWPVRSRKDLVELLEKEGVLGAVALWMTTNLVANGDGLRLIFEPAELREMLLDFIKIDLWPEVLLLSQQKEIHLVAAEFGHRVDKEDEEKLIANTREGHGFFHVLPQAGHFVHVDNLRGLADIIVNNLLRLPVE